MLRFPVSFLLPIVLICGDFALGQDFIARHESTDLRVVSYNTNWDGIFPNVSADGAEKFSRIVTALAPDIVNLQEINRSALDVRDLMNEISPLGAADSWFTYKGRDNVIISKYPLSLTTSRTNPVGQRELAAALVDLPDDEFQSDLYLMNNHFACCNNYSDRQQQADSLVNWMRDARTPGESIDLPENTPMLLLGDLNIVDIFTPLATLLDGDIQDEARYGADSLPDWDGSSLTDVRPLHNGIGPEDYTWRNDFSSFAPGRLDFVLYTDSVLELANNFVLNTNQMSEQELATSGLEALDVVLNPNDVTRDNDDRYDHLPLVTDFRMPPAFEAWDFNRDGDTNIQDVDLLTGAIVTDDPGDFTFDLNSDGAVDAIDLTVWLDGAALQNGLERSYLRGDANLDGVVDAGDLNRVALNWRDDRVLWSGGDFSLDGNVDAKDLNFVALNWQQESRVAACQTPHSVPEPKYGTLGWLYLGCCIFLCRRNRTVNNAT